MQKVHAIRVTRGANNKVKALVSQSFPHPLVMKCRFSGAFKEKPTRNDAYFIFWQFPHVQTATELVGSGPASAEVQAECGHPSGPAR